MFISHHVSTRIKFPFCSARSLIKSSPLFLRTVYIIFSLMLEAGQEIFHIHGEFGLWWGAEGEVAEGRECPAEGSGHPRQLLLL